LQVPQRFNRPAEGNLFQQWIAVSPSIEQSNSAKFWIGVVVAHHMEEKQVTVRWLVKRKKRKGIKTKGEYVWEDTQAHGVPIDEESIIASGIPMKPVIEHDNSISFRLPLTDNMICKLIDDENKRLMNQQSANKYKRFFQPPTVWSTVGTVDTVLAITMWKKNKI